MNKLRKALHGEVIFKEVIELPNEAKIVKTNANYYVVGESETHGNDHRISCVEDIVELYMTEDDKLFIKNIGNTDVFCPNETRHATIELPAGVWEVGHAQEYDYFSESHRKVRD